MGALVPRPLGGVLLSTGVTLGVGGAVLIFTALGELLITIHHSLVSPLGTIGIGIGLAGVLLVSAGWTLASKGV